MGGGKGKKSKGKKKSMKYKNIQSKDANNNVSKNKSEIPKNSTVSSLESGSDVKEQITLYAKPIVNENDLVENNKKTNNNNWPTCADKLLCNQENDSVSADSIMKNNVASENNDMVDKNYQVGNCIEIINANESVEPYADKDAEMSKQFLKPKFEGNRSDQDTLYIPLKGEISSGIGQSMLTQLKKPEEDNDLRQDSDKDDVNEEGFGNMSILELNVDKGISDDKEVNKKINAMEDPVKDTIEKVSKQTDALKVTSNQTNEIEVACRQSNAVNLTSKELDTKNGVIGKVMNGTESKKDANNESDAKDPGASISIDIAMKHPLEKSWTLWYMKFHDHSAWTNCQNKICTVSTVEDFWGLYHWTVKPSLLNVGCDYSFFKSGIKPMWEDLNNKKGGRWYVQYPKSEMFKKDDDWKELLLLLIGNELGHFDDDVNGVVFNRRRMDKLGIWLKNANSNKVTDIGYFFKQHVFFGSLNFMFNRHGENKAIFTI